jgi:hypothetical protein
MKKLHLPVITLAFMFLPLFLYAMSAPTDVIGTLKVSAGYYGENNYIDDLQKKSLSGIADEGFIAGDPIQIEDSTVVMGISLDFAVFWNHVGVGISSGVYGFLNYVYLPYDDVDGTVSVPEISDKPYARLKINSYLFPQNVNVYWRYPLGKGVSVNISGGPGYYLTYTTRRTEYMGVGDTVPDDVKQIFHHFNDINSYEHDFGVQVSVGFSYAYSKSMSFDFGVQLHAIFATSPFKLVAVGYIGVTEKIDLNL